MGLGEILTIVVSAVVGGLITALGAWIKSLRSARKKKAETEQIADDATHDGLQSILRNSIIQDHDKYVELGFCPVYVKESIASCYQSYHNLGGNGIIDKLYQDIVKLPEKPKKTKTKEGD